MTDDQDDSGPAVPWRRLYALVIGTLVVEIAALALLTRVFAP